MAYSDFTLDAIRKSFGITLKRDCLFPANAPVDVPTWLTALLEKGMPLAFVSEKSRAEFIIVPILLASRDLAHASFTIYSGQRLDSDLSRGLSGECDFILSLTPPLPVLQYGRASGPQPEALCGSRCHRCSPATPDGFT